MLIGQIALSEYYGMENYIPGQPKTSPHYDKYLYQIDRETGMPKIPFPYIVPRPKELVYLSLMGYEKLEIDPIHIKLHGADNIREYDPDKLRAFITLGDYWNNILVVYFDDYNAMFKEVMELMKKYEGVDDLPYQELNTKFVTTMVDHNVDRVTRLRRKHYYGKASGVDYFKFELVDKVERYETYRCFSPKTLLKGRLQIERFAWYFSDYSKEGYKEYLQRETEEQDRIDAINKR